MYKTLIYSTLNTSSNFLKPRFAYRGFESLRVRHFHKALYLIELKGFSLEGEVKVIHKVIHLEVRFEEVLRGFHNVR